MEGEVLKLDQLISKLPTEAKKLEAGFTDPKEAWKLLEERYRDKKNNSALGNAQAKTG